MQYRKFGKLDWHASALGFGCMRLPTLDGKPLSGNINEDESIRMIRYAIDHGVNYIDTAYPYHDKNSEIITGKALKDGYREKVKVATKSPVWGISKTEDFDKYLNRQLEKLQTDQIDFYLFHGLDKKRWDNVVLKLNLLERAESALRDGKIGYLGFSFHDRYEVFQEIIDGYNGWTFCQIQYNYMDIEHQAGSKGLRYAASKGLAVVIMEPLLGGRLANPPATVLDVFKGHGERTPVDWALQWVWNQPEVSLLLSGMSTMRQVEENILSANKSGTGSMGAEELEVIQKARAKYKEMTLIPCTKCGYCLPCPNGVNIPRNIKLFNDGFTYGDVETCRSIYANFMAAANRAVACIQCKECEEKCPQKIIISEWMPKAHAVLGEGKPY
ncbi:aldo/keto reductase [Pelotomaculum propionicicum]|uniref:General stress protein 69 n=1 Tax=Pelotomaculum propionicicum TaxID=258475 RepID=A0A4Y7RNE2_9FIRM|nr:aldo/keto reductase [Pelotomaculum propionicicum]TEB10495.1 General stress protein 69 [Pelotomaculum propionicicum]